MGGEELVDRLFGPAGAGGEYDRDVSVAGGPDVLKQAFGGVFAERGDGIAEPVESGAKRRAPALVPPLASAVAAAVGTPALDTVGTTPRGIVDDFRLPLGWELGQELAVIDQPRQLLVFDEAQGIGESHFSMAMVVAITLAVGGHMHHLRFRVAGVNATSQPPGVVFSVIEQAFEGDRARQWAVVEEDGNAASLLQVNQVRMVGIDGGVGRLGPASAGAIQSGRERVAG